MEIVTATPNNGSPFHNHDVREWSRLDSITGVLERARLETDHWTANTATTSHNYNKVVDSRARTGADGNQQQARRKLEVFHSQVPGGRIQVIKTQTVSSSRWSSSSQCVTNGEPKPDTSAFADLKLSLNPLDLTSEKTKASVGRGVGRRPPSRSRIRDDILARNTNLHSTATTNLHRVSRLCHQIHNSAVRQTFGKFTTCADQIEAATLPIDERESGDGVEITEIIENEPTTHHTNLTRTKSTSSEDLFEKRKSLEDLEDLEQLQNWRRTSKIRRSLQYPKQKETRKPPDLPTATGSVRKIREDLETGRRLSTALRGNNVDLDALDQILKSISNSSISSTQSNPDQQIVATAKKEKRNSFVTVESIQAVRDRLRRTSSSPGIDIYEQKSEQQKDEDDDGIVTDKPVNLKQLELKNDVNDEEDEDDNMDSNKKTMSSGTGSLESRNKCNHNYNKHDDWFARRKSYGFEQMHQQQQCAAGNGNALRHKNRNESSTDSGICRSSEIVVVSPPTKVNLNRRGDFNINDVIKDDNVTNVKKYAMIFENKNDNAHKNAIKLAARKESTEAKRHSIAVDESKYMNNKQENQFKRTSLVINDSNNNHHHNSSSGSSGRDEDIKKTNKKVEFCKTEVHFAADSGRVNIVETDEKPPPTQRFRRRRRNSSGPSETTDYNRNGLPVQHFGDSSYEKFLFGEPLDEAIYENLQPNQQNDALIETPNVGTVTVNAAVNRAATNYYCDVDEEPQREKDKENDSNEAAPRSILKNKPKPFLFDHVDDDAWDQPMWKSTVTLKNDEKDKEKEHRNQKEFQMLRQQLRPTSRRLDFLNDDAVMDLDVHDEDDEDVAVENSFSAFKDVGCRMLSPPVDDRCSSWSVADRIKQVEDLKWTENKGYSTKVNFGNGEAIVVENKHTTWPRKDDFKEIKKRNLLNKGLVVRIGGENEHNSNAKHKVCSKTMTNNNTTTTKITIDLTPSPTNANDANDFKFPRAAIQTTFKSPSLIMNTFVRNSESKSTHDTFESFKLPQLEDLKRMYEDVHSDSEADKEVHRILMNSTDQDDEMAHESEPEPQHGHESSVLSGSWSKMRAFKHVQNNFNYQKTQTINQTVNAGSHVVHALLAKDANKTNTMVHNDKYKLINEQIEKDLKYLNQEVKNLNLNKNAKSISKSPLNNYNEKLSSPFLVGQNRSRNNSFSSDPESVTVYDKKKMESPKVSQQSVLRQPKRSEMAYFGVNTKSKTATNTTKLSQKPDLLQFNNHNNTILNKKSSFVSTAPIYENLSSKPSKTFDSSILEELTKAADEILLAVNGYTDEERNKLSTDDEARTRRRNEKLDTITENKSWKQSMQKAKVAATTSKTLRLRNDAKSEKLKSSNSSIDSISRECHRSFEHIDRKTSSYAAKTTATDLKARKKVTSTETTMVIQGNVKATTKARRLQRASSREALLQSHGSSSEDLPNQTDVIRKPRLVKRHTKTTQLTVTNGLEVKKPNRKQQDDVAHKTSKHERTIIATNLPEIRHKTAVSTIRSTAEKQAASRERAKLKSDELAKKQRHLQTASGASTNNKRETTSKVVQPSKAIDRSKRSKESGRHTSMFNQTQHQKKSSTFTRTDAITTKH